MNDKQIIQAYERMVSYDPNFALMIKEIIKNSSGIVLEPGSGTGLLTKELLQKVNSVIPVESSAAFIAKFRRNLPKQNIIEADAVTYRNACKVDSIAMSLVWHHIEDYRKYQFLKNMHTLLKRRGNIVIGDVFLLPYKNESERDERLCLFHYDRISRMKNKSMKNIEKQALHEGLARKGEYKTSEGVLRLLLAKAGFSKIKTIEMGNQNVGGYRVIIAEKESSS